MKHYSFEFDRQLYDLLCQEQHQQFTTRQLRDAYAATLDFPGYELGEVRIFVYEQIRRLIRSGWVVKSPKLSKRGQLFHLLEMPAHINLVLVASRFQGTDTSSRVPSESVERPLSEAPTPSAQNESDDQSRLRVDGPT